MLRSLVNHIALGMLIMSLLAQPLSLLGLASSPIAEQLEETSKVEEKTEYITHQRKKEAPEKPFCYYRQVLPESRDQNTLLLSCQPQSRLFITHRILRL